jgi:TatD DNase family protein
MSHSRDLPRLDTHAHISPDVTEAQIRTLEGALIFAMTRDLDESEFTQRRMDATILWGVGTHPGVPAALAQFDVERFRRLVRKTALVGEVGLDRRGDQGRQSTVFESILQECRDQPILISVHSTGRTAAVIEAIKASPHPGVVLHWFVGTSQQIDDAAATGAYFSVNAAMPADVVRRMPPERLLPETDFPSSRRTTQARVPGDVAALERLMATESGDLGLWRARWHQNLARLLDVSGARTRLPQGLAMRLANSHAT